MTKRELARLVQESLTLQRRYYQAPSGSFEKEKVFRDTLSLERRLWAACREVLDEPEPTLFDMTPEEM